MNKKILISLLVIFGLIITGLPLITDSSGTTNSEVVKHSLSVEEVLSEIRSELKLGKDQPIRAGKVNNRLLEELGEAVSLFSVCRERCFSGNLQQL